MTPRHGLELPMSGPEPKPVNANGCGCTFSAAMPAVYSLSPCLAKGFQGLLPRTHVTWVNATRISLHLHGHHWRESRVDGVMPPTRSPVPRRCVTTHRRKQEPQPPLSCGPSPPRPVPALPCRIVYRRKCSGLDFTIVGTYGMHCAMLLHLWAFGSYRSTFCNSGISVTVLLSTELCHGQSPR
ncbi:hypothetical protein IAQ61_006699 [Plenodomus lingam]|uniref:uncharacterized protein n=1 Tax=Leptosphaeria maculans TaxID=5022 RepID=UPI003322B6B9|nr:hypothetical protein IAQ61_006699 [Plenodomus lingam]